MGWGCYDVYVRRLRENKIEIELIFGEPNSAGRVGEKILWGPVEREFHPASRDASPPRLTLSP